MLENEKSKRKINLYKNMKNYIIAAIIILVGVVTIGLMGFEIKSLKTDNTRLTSNQTTLNTEVKKWKTKDSLNVALAPALTYTQSEVAKYDPALVQTVKKLGVQLKNVQSILDTRTITQTKFKTTVRDSISLVDTLKCFNYSDQFTKLTGCFNLDTVNIDLKTFDSLTTVVSRVPAHRFLWWTWGVKGINLSILSKNPNTTFDYLKYIELKK